MGLLFGIPLLLFLTLLFFGNKLVFLAFLIFIVGGFLIEKKFGKNKSTSDVLFNVLVICGTVVFVLFVIGIFTMKGCC